MRTRHPVKLAGADPNLWTKPIFVRKLIGAQHAERVVLALQPLHTLLNTHRHTSHQAHIHDDKSLSAIRTTWYKHSMLTMGLPRHRSTLLLSLPLFLGVLTVRVAS